MQETHSPLSAGQAIVVRDERWTVLAVDRFDNVAIVSLRGTEDDNRNEISAVLTPADLIPCRQEAVYGSDLDARCSRPPRRSPMPALGPVLDGEPRPHRSTGLATDTRPPP